METMKRAHRFTGYIPKSELLKLPRHFFGDSTAHFDLRMRRNKGEKEDWPEGDYPPGKVRMTIEEL